MTKVIDDVFSKMDNYTDGSKELAIYDITEVQALITMFLASKQTDAEYSFKTKEVVDWFTHVFSEMLEDARYPKVNAIAKLFKSSVKLTWYLKNTHKDMYIQAGSAGQNKVWKGPFITDEQPTGREASKVMSKNEARDLIAELIGETNDYI